MFAKENIFSKITLSLGNLIAIDMAAVPDSTAWHVTRRLSFGDVSLHGGPSAQMHTAQLIQALHNPTIERLER